MTAAIEYDIVKMNLQTHEFELRMHVLAPDADGVALSLPAWIPGSYMIRDFARNIIRIGARDDRGPVALNKLDKQSWQTGPCVGDLIVEYRIYAFDLSVRSAYLDDTRAYFNGTCLFLAVDGRVDAPWQLTIRRPQAGSAADWQVASTLPAAEVDSGGFGRYQGESYSTLIDYPVEIGNQKCGEFTVDGIRHEMAVTDGGNFDIGRICRDLEPICGEHAAMFGELPIARYLFLTLATADGYGGLEHLDSTSLICKRSDLPAPGMDRPDKGYRQFLGLCSHEYFHLWNVKRIRPEALARADLSGEVHTELLWAFEGITSYYDDLALARSGVIETNDYLELLATVVTRVMRGAGRTLQSVAESSFDAWTKFYKQDENALNAIVSYYTKGSLVAFGLDVSLRVQSHDRLCLDDLMRHLWREFGKTGRGIPERGIEHEIAAILGQPMAEFFDCYVYGTEELPLAEWFAHLGIGFRLRAAKDDTDTGGTSAALPTREPPVSLGARYESNDGGLKLTTVFAGSAAQRAGLASGDIVIALDGEKLNSSNLQGLLKRVDGEHAELHYFRRGRLTMTQLPINKAIADTCDLWLLPEDQLASDVLRRRNAWLRSNRRGDD